MNISNRARLFLAVLVLALGQSFFVFAQTVPMDTTATDTTAPEMSGPAISNVAVTDITDTSARIDINSDELVQGYVEYGESGQYGMSTPLTSEFSTSPSFLLENLTPETLYHYRVIVMDSAGNVTITGDETFTTLTTPVPPPTEPTTTATTTESTTTATSTFPALAISNTETTSVGTSTARIAWQTNKDADSQVEYGTTTAYGSLTSVGATALSHVASLASLTPSTKYYYRAISRTASGEVARSLTGQFTTLAVQTVVTYPVISNVSIDSVSTSTAAISWTTSKPATSDIQYGTTTSYGSLVGLDQTFKTAHTRAIANLTTATLYHFRIVGADSEGNTVFGKDRTFTTTAAQPLVTTPAATSSSDTLLKITEQGAKSAVTIPQGGGGLPVAPFRPHLLKVTPLDAQVSFEWRKDKSMRKDTIRTLIVKKQGTSSVLSRIDGEIIYDGLATTFTDTNVENGKEYHYALYSYGTYGRFTTAARFKAIPKANKEQVDFSAQEVKEQVASPLTFTRDLFQGKRGDDVIKLQTYLAEHGYYPEALVTGYFGVFTERAVIRLQKLNNISPTVGYVGSITRATLEQ